MFDKLYIRYNEFLLTVLILTVFILTTQILLYLRWKHACHLFSLSHTLSCRENQKITKNRAVKVLYENYWGTVKG